MKINYNESQNLDKMINNHPTLTPMAKILDKLFGWVLCSFLNSHQQYNQFKYPSNRPSYGCQRSFCQKGYYGDQMNNGVFHPGKWQTPKQMLKQCGIKEQPMLDVTDASR